MRVVPLNQTDDTEDCDNNESIVFMLVFFYIHAFIIRCTSGLKCHMNIVIYLLWKCYNSIFMYIL